VNEEKKIIHVDFASGTVKRLARQRAAPPPKEPISPSVRDKEPLTDLYTFLEVSKLFAIAPSRLKYWERSGFIVRSGKQRRRRYYTFLDLISIRTAKGLLDKGVVFRRVRRSIEALRASLPKTARPLNSLRIFADGHDLVVKDDHGRFEPSTGQTVIDFEVGSLSDDVVRVLGRDNGQKSSRAAYDHYLDGCRLDQNERTWDGAETAYRTAIELDPSLGNAYTNLGNLLFRRGKTDMAEVMFIKALRVDPEQPEAFYNLGFLKYDRGDTAGALENFKRAIRSSPSFADAHFNLAMVLEDLGQRQEARPHWETYLLLDPTSSWADIARTHLK
jgi:tetratricopeptide (TPR) repeat protein